MRIPRLTARLALTLVALVMVTMILMGVAVSRSIRNTIAARLESNRSHVAAYLTRELERQIPPGEPINRTGADFVARLGNEVYSAVTLRDAQGRVIRYSGRRPMPFSEKTRAECDANRSSVGRGILGIYPEMVTVTVGGNARLGYLQLGYNSALYGMPIAPIVAPVMLIGLGLTVLAILIAVTITRPLKTLTTSMDRIAAGDLQHRIPVSTRDEFGDVARAFNEMTAQLGGLLRSQREFLAGVSHELRSPLTRIRLAIEILRDQTSSPALLTPLDHVEEDITALDRLIGQLLTASRLELASEPFKPASVHVRELLEEMVRREADTAAARRIEVRIDADPQAADVSIPADENLLLCALTNLLNNAIKYSPEGATVRLRWRIEQNQVRIEVIDEGMGIPEADLPRLSEPFFRTDRSRSRQTGGVGLGLMLVKRIVERHGGRMEVSSQVGEGSCFALTLFHTL